jgi:hypothetical protein
MVRRRERPNSGRVGRCKVSERARGHANRGYSFRMRRLVAVSVAAAPAVLAWACGGQEFKLGVGGDDATTSLRDAGDRDNASDAADTGHEPDGDASEDGVAADALDAAEEIPAHCAGAFTCAPSAPTGWAGPFELYAGSNPVPSCEIGFGGTTLDGNAGLSALAASCDCQCAPPQGLRCGSPPLVFSATPTACTTTCATAILTPGACTAVDVKTRCGLGITGAGVVIAAPPMSAPGSCAAVSTVTVPTASWATNARACSVSVASRADCKGSSVCIPAPSAPFLASVCIEQAGDVACPLTDFTIKHAYYGGVDDTRSCASCTCGAVSGASCSGTLTQYRSADGGCDTAQTVYDLPLTCSPIQQPADLILSVTPSTGGCKPSSPSATGTATPALPMTFCCLP